MNGITPVSVEDLLACLDKVPPVELLGLTLLEQCQPSTGWFPGDVPMEAVVKATIQLIGYGERARYAAEKLSDLRAIPLALPIEEYGL